MDFGCVICPVCGDPITSENIRVNRILRDMADEVRQRRVDLRVLKRNEDIDVNNWETEEKKKKKKENVKTSKSLVKEGLAARKTERKLKSSLTTGPWEGILFGIIAFYCFISVLTYVVLPCVEYVSVTMSGNAAKVFGSPLVFMSMFVVFGVVAHLVDFVLKKIDLKSVLYSNN